MTPNDKCDGCEKTALLNNTDPADVCGGCDIFEAELDAEDLETVVEEKEEDDWDYTDDLEAFLGGW